MPKLPKITSLLFLCNILRKKWEIKLIFCMQISIKVSYKLILWFLMGMVKHSQSSQNTKFTMSLQYLKKEVRDEVPFFYMQKSIKDFLKLILPFSVCVAKHAKIIQNNKFAISLQYLKEWVMKLFFCMQITMKVSYKLILWFLMGWSSILKILKIAILQCLYIILKKKLEMKLIFYMQINTKASYKLISTLWASKFSARRYYH